MNARDLKPCPFCGGDARLDISDETVWRVECVHCDCNYGHIFRDEAQAIESWNTRAALPEQGTPEARLAGVVEIAKQYCGYQGIEAHGPETAIIRELEKRRDLPEQPLSRKWREEADEIEKSEGEPIAPEDGQVSETLRRCAADLDSQRDRDREFMQRLEERLRARYVGATEDIDSVLVEFASEIRNHLGGKSDES